jgi:hypothetical protein
MSSPFVTGCGALVLQSIGERVKNKELTPIATNERALVAKRDLELTTKIIDNTSATVTGTGLVQVDKACENPVDIIWDENNNGALDASETRATVALRSFTTQKSFSVFVRNRANHTLNYKLTLPAGVSCNDLNKQNKVQLKKDEVKKLTFTVTPNVPVNHFQDGHILFANENEPTLNLTYMGYVGDYTEGDKIFDAPKGQPGSVCNEPAFYTADQTGAAKPVTDIHAITYVPNEHNPLSPNLALLRDAKNVVATITDANGNVVNTLNPPVCLTRSKIMDGVIMTTYQQVADFDWYGKDDNGDLVPAGNYTYHLSAETYADGKYKHQQVEFPITVER